MEAKDTVHLPKGFEGFDHSLQELIEGLLKCQAEISFGAGKREVVEFIDKNFKAGSYQSGTYHFYTILAEVWQAQKKKWDV